MVQNGVERIEFGEDAVARYHVDHYERLAGFDSPAHDPVDPRTERLFKLLDGGAFPVTTGRTYGRFKTSPRHTARGC